MTSCSTTEARLLAMALAGLLVVAPAPGQAWQVLATLPVGAGSTTDPTAPVVAVVALAAWSLTGVLVACSTLLLLARLPGLVGRCAGVVAVRAVPAAVQRGLGVLLGAGLVLGTAGTLPASAQSGPSSTQAAATSGAAVSLDWPSTPARTPAPTPATTSATTPSAQALAVVVAPGDTLWGLAERSLRSAGATPSVAAVAAAWPSWWAANREVVGEDPHLLHPGTRLTPPPA